MTTFAALVSLHSFSFGVRSWILVITARIFRILLVSKVMMLGLAFLKIRLLTSSEIRIGHHCSEMLVLFC